MDTRGKFNKAEIEIWEFHAKGMQFKAKNFISFTIFAFLSVLLYIYNVYIRWTARRRGKRDDRLKKNRSSNRKDFKSATRYYYYLFSRVISLFLNESDEFLEKVGL